MTSPGQKDGRKSLNREDIPQRETSAETIEASKVLQIKRWEVQEGPFRGFGSPPGRF